MSEERIKGMATGRERETSPGSCHPPILRKGLVFLEIYSPAIPLVSHKFRPANGMRKGTQGLCQASVKGSASLPFTRLQLQSSSRVTARPSP